MNSELGERFPISNRHMRIKKWRLHAVVQRLFLRLRHLRTQIRHHRVVTRQYAMFCLHPTQLSIPHVRNIHLARTACPSRLFRVHHRCAQPDSHRILIRIQLRIIHFRRDHIFHRISRNAPRNQFSYQQSCDRRIAIWEMKNVWLLFFLRVQSQSVESRIRKRTVVIRVQVAAQGRDRFRAYRKKIVRPLLKKRQ